MKKWILGGLLVLLAALGGGIWWLYQSRDHLLADVIRDYGPRITGVSVKLGGVHIEPVDGLAAVKGLEIGNPPGFKTRRAIELGEVRMRLDVASLTSDVVHIHEVRIVAPHVTYERGNAGSNLEVIERNVQGYIAAQTGGTPKPQDKGEKKKKLIIDHLYILGAKADVSAAMLQGHVLTVPIADIHLQGLGEKSGGATPAEVTELVVSAVKNSITKSVTTAHATGIVNGIKNGAKAAVNAVKGLFK